MKNVILQYWEESERGWGTRPDGCSIHLNLNEYKKYIDHIYSERYDEVPDEYDRVVGNPIEAKISQDLLDKLMDKKSIRISQHETNNLLNLKDISPNIDEHDAKFSI